MTISYFLRPKGLRLSPFQIPAFGLIHRREGYNHSLVCSLLFDMLQVAHCLRVRCISSFCSDGIKYTLGVQVSQDHSDQLLGLNLSNLYRGCKFLLSREK